MSIAGDIDYDILLFKIPYKNVLSLQKCFLNCFLGETISRLCVEKKYCQALQKIISHSLSSLIMSDWVFQRTPPPHPFFSLLDHKK